MKAITIKQPFATLIVDGVKDVENRSWVLPKKYIGERVLIHASKNESFYKQMPVEMSFEQIKEFADHYNNTTINAEIFPLGAIIGSVVITGCVTDRESVWAMPDHFHFTLAHAVRFPEPIPATGKLGFWEYDAIKAEPEETGGALFCHCLLAVAESNQVSGDSQFGYYCKYCGGKWYK